MWMDISLKKDAIEAIGTMQAVPALMRQNALSSCHKAFSLLAQGPSVVIRCLSQTEGLEYLEKGST